MTICAPQLGQKAALWGLRNLTDWVAAERLEILRRRAAITAALSTLPGWRLLGCGAYFAYVEHPHPLPSNELAPLLVRDLSLLMLPGTMFAPAGDASAQRQLRIAFANVSVEGLQDAGGEAGDAGGSGGLDWVGTRIRRFRFCANLELQVKPSILRRPAEAITIWRIFALRTASTHERRRHTGEAEGG